MKSLFASVLAGLAVVALSVTTMAGAQASPEIHANTSSNGLSTENSAAQAPMTKSPVNDPSTRSLAKSKGLKLEGLTIQSDAIGGRFLLDTEGNWFLQIPSEPASLPLKQHALDVTLPANWSATGCVGSFKTMAKQTGELYWGATNSCASTSVSGVYPHWITGALRATCAGSWPAYGLYRDEDGPVSSTNNRSSRVANIYREPRCDTNANYRFLTSVRVYVRGIQFGPYESASKIFACNVTA